MILRIAGFEPVFPQVSLSLGRILAIERSWDICCKLVLVKRQLLISLLAFYALFTRLFFNAKTVWNWKSPVFITAKINQISSINFSQFIAYLRISSAFFLLIKAADNVSPYENILSFKMHVGGSTLWIFALLASENHMEYKTTAMNTEILIQNCKSFFLTRYK